jgi:RNA polymerase sigma-70 factor (ECF subfamily)
MKLRIEKPSEMSDSDLATQAASGDKAAKRKLVERLMPRIRSTIHYLAPKDRDADDLVQLTFIEILHSISSFRGECLLETWASKIAVRTAMHHLKKRRFHLWSKDEEAKEPSHNVTPERQSEQLQLRRHLKQLLERLPLEQCTVIVLRFVHGMSLNEIAEVTESPLNTARERLRVGRQKFQRYMLQDTVLVDWMERRPK